MKKNYRLAFFIPIVALISIGHIYFLYGNPEIFIKEFLNGLLGALTVIAATGAIFIFQNNEEANREKQNLIYVKKVEFYQRIAVSLKTIIMSKYVTEKDYNELKVLRLETILICEDKSLGLFNNMLDMMIEVHRKNKRMYLSVEIESAILKLFEGFCIELMKDNGKSQDNKENMLKILNELGNLGNIEENQEKEKKVFRSEKQKFEILKDFANSMPENIKKLEVKHKIKDLKLRVKLFKNQIKNKGYAKDIEALGISLNEEKGPVIGSNLKNK